MANNKETKCLDCWADRGRDFPASHVAPFFIPRGEPEWNGERMMWDHSKGRGENRPVCDEHKSLNDIFWAAFTGKKPDGIELQWSATRASARGRGRQNGTDIKRT